MLSGSAEPGANNHRQWTLRQRVTALCLLTAAVLTFLAAGATTAAMANRDQLDNLLDRITPMRAAASDLEAALVDQQTAVRSYVLNGFNVELARYREELTRERTAAAAISGSVAATPQIKEQLRVAAELADRWRAEIADPAIAARAGGDRAGAEARLDDPAGVPFDQVRAAVVAMEESMRVVRDDAVASIKDTSTTLQFVLVVAVILVIAGGVALVMALQTTVVGPLTDLAAQVRRVARGSYGTAITTSGPPELQRLAFDVNSMRQQITSDLAEVEAARREIEEAKVRLEQQAVELVRSNRDLEQFAYVASHDLQEPLRKVSSFCQLLQRRYEGQLDERAQEYITFAVNGAQRMQRLITDLLTFSRIGRATTGFVDVDLNRLVADEVAQLDLSAEPNGADIAWSDLPVVRGEEALLATLFANLIGNAVKFHRPGEPARVRLSARLDDEVWEISCVDNGIGIEEEYAEKVFVIFQRLHSRDTYPGTGIGLAIAKKIVEYHDGTIWIDTTYQGGTAVRFTLPAMPTAAVDRTTGGATQRESPAGGPTPEAPTAAATASASRSTSESSSAPTVNRNPGGELSRNSDPGATAQPRSRIAATAADSSDVGTQTLMPLAPRAATPLAANADRTADRRAAYSRFAALTAAATDLSRHSSTTSRCSRVETQPEPSRIRPSTRAMVA
jgi:signal transduction histidine kinase